MSTSAAIAVEVPDIGDFADVPVIEVLVSEGDTVAAEDPLVTLESDKATMDVPAPFAGRIAAVSVSVGDRVSQGSEIVRIEPVDQAPTGTTAAAAASEGAPTEAEAPDALGSAIEAEAGGPAGPDDAGIEAGGPPGRDGAGAEAGGHAGQDDGGAEAGGPPGQDG